MQNATDTGSERPVKPQAAQQDQPGESDAAGTTVTFDCAHQSCTWYAPHTSLLDVAAASAIPTIAACGGNGICSTCRVEVLEGLEHLAPRSAAEESQARKRNWPDNVRLACATRVIGSGDVKVRRLITPPSERKRQRRQEKQQGLGQIRSLAVLFADMRNFTPITESCAAFDVIYILNRYFTTLKQAVTNHGGQVNLYVGDQISAVFGLEEDARVACHQAVSAGIEMQQRIATLSRVIQQEFEVSLSIGVGIHYGPVIVGRVGPVDDLRFGLVGESVNVASRLESQTKELGVPILISTAVQEHLGALQQGWRLGEPRCLQLKGIREPVLLHPVIPAEDGEPSHGSS